MDSRTPPRRPPGRKERAVEAMQRDLDAVMEEAADLSEVERQTLAQCLEEIMEHGESITASTLFMEDYRVQPVTMEEFLTSDAYFGREAQRMMRPAIKGLLIESFDGDPAHPCTEIILSGSIGWGKSYAAAVALLYVIYRLTCLREPHAFYDLAGGSRIYIAIYSVSREQAEDSAYEKIRTWIDNMPYFREQCPRDRSIKARIEFTRSPVTVVTGSRELHTLGRDVFAFCLAEGERVQTDAGAVPVEALEPVAHRLVAPSGLETFECVDCVGERRCVKVDIGGGRTVTASEDHLFLVRTGSGVAWRKAVALRPGDDIVTLDEANYEGFDDDVSRANEDLLRVWRNEARRLRILRGDVQGTAHATGVV